MKKNYIEVIFYSLFFVLIFSCKQERPLYDGPDLVHFNVTEASYFIIDDNDSKFEIIVGSTVKSSNERRVLIEIDPKGTTAVEGEVFDIENKTVTIPADEFFGKLVIKGNYTHALTTGDTLKLKIKSVSDGTIADFKNTLEVILYKFCPFNIDDFVGTFKFTSEAFETSYDVQLEKVDETTIKALSLYSIGKDISLLFDASDPSNFTVTVTKQEAWIHKNYGIVSVDGEGSFSACNGSISLNLEHTVAAGTFGSFIETFKKK